MSFASLSGNAAFSDPNQLPALLEYLDGNVSRLYDDGQGNPVSQLGSSFTNFSNATARTALQEALTGGNVVPGYPTITGYSQAALNWLQGGNPKHIDVTANIPEQNWILSGIVSATSDRARVTL